MKTRIIRIAESGGQKNADKKISYAAQIIRRGGIVAFPTETVYGLGANALDTKAVRKIFRAKGRPSDDPLIVHIADEHQLYELASYVPLQAKILMDKFWPGPLTIVLRKSKKVPRITTGGLDTVAIRMPSHSVALELLCAAGVPIAAPSANLFGRPSPTSAQHVLEDLNGKINAVLDGGRTRIGVESTVLDLSGKTPELLRPGKITIGQLQKIIGKIKVHPLVRSQPRKGGKKAAARSPGLSYRHYAPAAEVILVEGPKNSLSSDNCASITSVKRKLLLYLFGLVSQRYLKRSAAVWHSSGFSISYSDINSCLTSCQFEPIALS